jgi:uncharacterized protein YbjT (DUF2867 family)
MGKTIFVLGATGTVGRPLVSDLLSRGHVVRDASRSGEGPEGTIGTRFEFSDPASIDSALDGADAVFLMTPSGTLDVIGALTPVVEAAAKRGTKVVMLSVFGVDADDSIPYRQVELMLAARGLPHVVIRPNWFMDNFHTFWRAGVAAGAIRLPAGEGRSSLIDARDIAASAAAALSEDRFDGEAFDLTGPEALSYAEAAEILSKAAGRTIRYEAVSDEAFVGAVTAAGVDPAYAGFLAAIFHPVRENWTAAVTDGVERLTDTKPRSLAAYARDHAAALKG